MEECPSTGLQNAENGPAAESAARATADANHGFQSWGCKHHHDSPQGIASGLDEGNDEPRPRDRVPTPTMPGTLDPTGGLSLRAAYAESAQAASILAAQNRVLRVALEAAHEARATAAASVVDGKAELQAVMDEVSAAHASSKATEEACSSTVAAARQEIADLKQQMEAQGRELAAVTLRYEATTSTAEAAERELSVVARTAEEACAKVNADKEQSQQLEEDNNADCVETSPAGLNTFRRYLCQCAYMRSSNVLFVCPKCGQLFRIGQDN